MPCDVQLTECSVKNGTKRQFIGMKLAKYMSKREKKPKQWAKTLVSFKEIKVWAGDKLEGTDRQMMTVCNSSSTHIRYIHVVPENSPSYLLCNRTYDFSQKL